MINFQLNEDGLAYLTKKALVFVEGFHTDSQKREHSFSRDRLLQIIKNTNKKIREGVRIPFQRDHKKTQDFNLGDVEGEFYSKIITSEDLPNPKHTHLIGKLGVFVNNIKVKSKEAIQQVIEGGISTISAGIDPATECFIEVSATPFPAIVGPALFSQGLEEDFSILTYSKEYMDEEMEESMENDNSKVFSMEQALGLDDREASLKEDYFIMAKALYRVLSSLYMAGENELKDLNPIEESYSAIEFFVSGVEDIFGLTYSEEEEKENPSGITGSNIPGYNKKQMGFSKFPGKKTKKYVRF